MADISVAARVKLWGEFVGAVAEDSDGLISFEYDESFRRGQREISPINLPLSIAGPIAFPELRRSDAFQGLPGVLADSLPDRFGNAIISRYFEERGEPQLALSPVQRLLYVGSRAMGALQFEPALERSRRAEQMPLEIADLVAQSRAVIEGKSDTAIPEIMQVGASAGGMRPKALILWNRTTNVVRSGHAIPRDGDENWIVKFDGVEPLGADVGTAPVGGPAAYAPQPYMRIEYAYSRLARAAGVVLPESQLLRERDYAHFLIRRFDRLDNARLHQHTLGGMLHIDYNLPGACSYEMYFRTILRLGLGAAAQEEAYRRMVFNIASVNQDDHVKNFSFLMDGEGQWALSPAYDLTYARGHGWTRQHQMTVRGKSDGESITRADMMDFARDFGVARRAPEIIDQVGNALTAWEDVAQEAEVPQEWINRIGAEMRARRF